MRVWKLLLCLVFLASCRSAKKEGDFVKASETLQEEINEKIESIRYLQGEKLLAVLSRLVFIGEPAVPSLLKALEDEDDLTRSSAAFVLGEISIRHKRINGALRGLTRDPVPTVRYEAGASLLSLGDIYGAGVLIEGLRDEDPKNRFKSIKSLKEFLKKDFGYDPKVPPAEREKAVQQWEKWWVEVQEKM